MGHSRRWPSARRRRSGSIRSCSSTYGRASNTRERGRHTRGPSRPMLRPYSSPQGSKASCITSQSRKKASTWRTASIPGCHSTAAWRSYQKMQWALSSTTSTSARLSCLSKMVRTRTTSTTARTSSWPGACTTTASSGYPHGRRLSECQKPNLLRVAYRQVVPFAPYPTDREQTYESGQEEQSCCQGVETRLQQDPHGRDSSALRAQRLDEVLQGYDSKRYELILLA